MFVGDDEGDCGWWPVAAPGVRLSADSAATRPRGAADRPGRVSQAFIYVEPRRRSAATAVGPRGRRRAERTDASSGLRVGEAGGGAVRTARCGRGPRVTDLSRLLSCSEVSRLDLTPTPDQNRSPWKRMNVKKEPQVTPRASQMLGIFRRDSIVPR